MNLQDAPPGVLIVDTYAEFRSIVKAFADERYELLTIVGDGGIAKSEIVKESMREVQGRPGWDWGLIKGKHSPLDLYARLYRHGLVPVVLDDLDGLLRNPDNTAILKSICETTSIKRLEWGSAHASFAGRHRTLPKSFDSVSKVCVIANDFGPLTRNIQALHTRGVTILFRPTALELHQQVASGGWFDDAEIFSFLGEQLDLMARPSMRTYITARAHKQAGLDWKELTLRTMQTNADSKLALVARLLADTSYDEHAAPEAARVKTFVDHGAGSRATYYRCKAMLLAQRGKVDLALASSIELTPVRHDAHWYAVKEREEHYRQLRVERASAEVDENDGSKPADVGALDELERRCQQLAALRKKLQQAIRAEDYEQAASIRDEINRLEEA